MLIHSTRPPASPSFVDLQRNWTDLGYWSSESLSAALQETLRRHHSAVIDARSGVRPRRATYGDLLDASRRFAAVLRRLGVAPGDRILIQLPNWFEHLVCFTGAMFAGAVVVPLAPFYGSWERAQTSRAAGVSIWLVPTRFHGRDFVTEVRGDPDAPTTVFVGAGAPAGGLDLDDLLNVEQSVGPGTPASAEDIAVIAFTSGTTGAPKGALLSHRSLLFEATTHASIVLPEQAPALAPSPLGHVSGLISGFLVPILRGSAIHLVDHWAPTDAAELVRTGRLSVGNGAPVFLQSLTELPDFDANLLRDTSVVTLGGASISPDFCARVQSMGIDVIRVYGCTEHPVSTGASASDPADKRTTTDGRALPGVELRIVGDDDRPVTAGTAGELWTRGPDSSEGYLDPAATREAFTDDGWFRTGDIGVLDDEGWLTIVDRRKDIIIRNGLNISAREVELAIATHPGVAEVAVVARPSSRTGEKVVAIIRQHSGTTDLDVASIGLTIAEAGLAKFKWPEEIVRVQDFPRTPSGKIAKAELRSGLAPDARPDSL
jgi:acyl-CoA synthetase